MNDLNWEIFTPQEQDKLKQAIKDNRTEALAPCVDEMNQEKEAELQKIVNSMTNVSEGFESSVRDKFWKKNGNGPQTPEEEAKLQKEIVLLSVFLNR